MNKHRQLLDRLKKRHFITSLVFMTAACGLAVYLFSSLGPVYKYLHADLNFLILPFCGYYFLRFLSRTSGAQIRSFKGKTAANILNGAAFALAGYIIFSRALLFTRLPGLGHAQGFFLNVSHLAVPVVIFFAGYTLYKIAKLLTITKFEESIAPAGAAIGLIIMGGGLWSGFKAFAPSWPAASQTGLIFFAAFLASAAANLGGYGRHSANPLLSTAARWLEDSPTAKFFLGGLIATYFIFVRPAIFAVFPYAFLVEWLIFCFIAWRLFSMVRGSLQKQYSAPLKESAWYSHIQKVNELTDDDFIKLATLQKDYVEIGARQYLLAYLKQILSKNGLSDDEIGRTLRPIIEHNDQKAPWYTFGLLRKRFSQRNRQNRLTSLGNTILKMSDLTHAFRH